jgi:hypothetical protein
LKLPLSGWARMTEILMFPLGFAKRKSYRAAMAEISTSAPRGRPAT